MFILGKIGVNKNNSMFVSSPSHGEGSQPWSNTSRVDWYERAPTSISKQEHCIVKWLRLKRAAQGLRNGSIMVTAAVKVNAEPASFGQGEHDIDSPKRCPQRVTDSRLAAFVNGVTLGHPDL